MEKSFDHREALIAYVKMLAPWAEGVPSEIKGGREAAVSRLSLCDPISYGKNRNYGSGSVSRLSPYIHHGILSLNEVRNWALSCCDNPQDAHKFIQELAWRDYWQRVLQTHPEWAWEDAESYKTGFSAKDYSDSLPDDIAKGQTGIACLDTFIHQLINTGYIHNHARMYLASYVVHFRRIKWQIGASWFLHHLLDGDIASNNLSWQWIASTFSNKPYIFNLENVHHYFSDLVDTSPALNRPLNATYDELIAQLFPLLRDIT